MRSKKALASTQFDFYHLKMRRAPADFGKMGIKARSLYGVDQGVVEVRQFDKAS